MLAASIRYAVGDAPVETGFAKLPSINNQKIQLTDNARRTITARRNRLLPAVAASAARADRISVER